MHHHHHQQQQSPEHQPALLSVPELAPIPGYPLASEGYNSSSSPRQDYTIGRQQPLRVDTYGGSDQNIANPNTSPNLKAARQRLITDVYGSAGIK